jgi:hypothetical protein
MIGIGKMTTEVKGITTVGADLTAAVEGALGLVAAVGAERTAEVAAALPAQLPVLRGRVIGREILGKIQEQTPTRRAGHTLPGATRTRPELEFRRTAEVWNRCIRSARKGAVVIGVGEGNCEVCEGWTGQTVKSTAMQRKRRRSFRRDHGGTTARWRAASVEIRTAGRGKTFRFVKDAGSMGMTARFAIRPANRCSTRPVIGA